MRSDGLAWPAGQSRAPQAPVGGRRVVWISVAAVAALLATALTFTASNATSSSPPSSITAATAAAEAADRVEQVASDRLVVYGFESDDGLAGWSADEGVSLIEDAELARTGTTSLAAVRARDADPAHVEVRASFGALVPPPALDLDGASMTCHVRPRGTPAGSDLRARMTALDADRRKDEGPVVALDAHRWTAVSMQVGAVDEVGIDGGVATQAPRFDGARTVALLIRVEAAAGALGDSVNIDDCMIEASDRAADDRARTDDAAAAPVARSPDVTPSVASTPTAGTPRGRSPDEAPHRGDRPHAGDPPAGAPRSGSPDAPDGDGGAEPGGIASYGFEAGDALQGWTPLDAATLTADRSVARGGQASLQILPPPDTAVDHVAVRATLRDLSPPPDFPLRGALLTCHVRAAASDEDAPNMQAVAVALARDGDMAAGDPVAVTSRRWKPVTVELAAGHTQAAAVHVATASGTLPAAVHIDDCSLQQAPPNGM